MSGVNQSYVLMDQTRIGAQSITDAHPFHIFAWIAIGASDVQKRDFNITSQLISEFRAHDSASSSTYEEDMRNNFNYLQSQLAAMGMPQSTWDDILRILVAVLHLQRLAVSGSDAATISAATKAHVLFAESALQMEQGTLGAVLLKKKMDISGSVSYKNLSQEDSSAAIYSLGAELYKLVFDYLLDFCGAFTDGGDGSSMPGPVLQVVDVPGNECFASPPNALAQFCINLLDEKLNQHLLHCAFQREIEFLRSEGAEAPPVGDVADPEPILALLEYPPAGMVSLIEEASLFPKGNDNALLDKIFSTHSKGKLVKTAGRGAKTSFVVKHMFGDVQYDINGFVAANKVRLGADGKALIKQLVTERFQFLAGKGSADAAEEDSSASTKARRAMDKSAMKAAFVANVYRDETQKLIGGFGSSDTEGDADPIFVFCLRGSSDLRGFTFDPSYVQPQVKFLNLPEMATFCKMGYACRRPYKEFYERYRVMFAYRFDGLPWKMPSEGDDKVLVRGLLRECASAACEPNLLTSPDLSPVFGTTFLFLREKTVDVLERTRSDILRKYAQAVVLIQAGARMALAKKRYGVLSRGIVMAQTLYRTWRCVKKYRSTLNAARRIQGYHRMKKLSGRYREVKNAVMVIKRRLLDKMILRIRYKKLQRASRALHFLARGLVVRQQINHVIRAVLTLQTLAKDFLKRNRRFYFRKVAVVLIQKLFRGSYVRHLNRPIVRALKIRRNQRIGTAAIKKLQARWRMKRVRRRFVEICTAARTIRCWAIARKEREVYLKKLVVVKWLQCLTRKIVATNYVHSLRVLEMLKEEVETLSKVRHRELSLVCYKDMSTEEFPSSRIGGGYYRHAREKYGRYLVGLDVTFDISVAYPKGWVAELLSFDASLRSSGQKRLSMVAVGRNHTVMVDTSSNVYTFGLGDAGQLGHGTFGNELEPRSLDTLGYQAAAAEGRGISKQVTQRVEVLAVAAGRDHTLLLAGSRRVYSWGSNRRGQLGHSNFKTSSLPRLVQGPINVKSIACGSYHSACLADPGILHCWGARECLGRRAEGDCSEAQTLPFFTKRRVQLLVTGDTHVTVRSGSDFYSWGLNTYGQLGRGDPSGSGSSVKDGAAEAKRDDLFSGGNDVGGDSQVDSDEDGADDISWARSTASSRHNTLIEPKKVRRKVGHSMTPVRVQLPSDQWSEGDLLSCSLVCGGRHVLLALKSRIWAWGWNRYGQVGNGSLQDSFTPIAIPINGPKSSLALRVGVDKISKKAGTSAVRIASVVAGWRHSMLVTKGGVVYVWGMSGLHASNVMLMPPPAERPGNPPLSFDSVAGAYLTPIIAGIKSQHDEHKAGEAVISETTDGNVHMTPEARPPLAVLKSDDPEASVLLTPHMVELPLRMQSHDVLGLFACSSSTVSMTAVELLEKDPPTTPLYKSKHKSNRHAETLTFHNSASMQKEVSERVRKELGGWSRAAFQSGPQTADDNDGGSVSTSSSSPVLPKVWGDRQAISTGSVHMPARGGFGSKTSRDGVGGSAPKDTNKTTPTSDHVTPASATSSIVNQLSTTQKNERHSREGEVTEEGLLTLFSPVKRPVSYSYCNEAVDIDSLFRRDDDDSENDSNPSNQLQSIAQVRKEAEARRRLSFHSMDTAGGGLDRRNVSLASKARKRRSSVASLRRDEMEGSVDSGPRRLRGEVTPVSPLGGGATIRPQFDRAGVTAKVRNSIGGVFAAASPPPSGATAPPAATAGSTIRNKTTRQTRELQEINSLQQSVQSLKEGTSRARLAGSSPQRKGSPLAVTSGDGATTGTENDSLGLDMIAVSDLAAMIQSIKKESLHQMSMSWRQT